MTAIIAFEKFMKSTGKQGQSLHRDNLVHVTSGGDELMPVTRDIDTNKLAMTPQLMKERQYELSNELAQKPAPTLDLGLGLGGTSTANNNHTLNLQNRSPKPPTDHSDKG